ncbi:unnamed protein product [Lampetra fluviatilis]
MASIVAELNCEEPAVEERAPEPCVVEHPIVVSRQRETSVTQPTQVAAILLAERGGERLCTANTTVEALASKTVKIPPGAQMLVPL